MERRPVRALARQRPRRLPAGGGARRFLIGTPIHAVIFGGIHFKICD